jgi:hypothetical protein
MESLRLQQRAAPAWQVLKSMTSSLAWQVLQLGSLALMALRLARPESLLVPTAPRQAGQVLQLESLSLHLRLAPAPRDLGLESMTARLARQVHQLKPRVALRLARLESLLVPTAPRLALQLESLPPRLTPARQVLESTSLARQVLQLESLVLMALRLARLDLLLVVPKAPPRLAQQVLQLESLQLRLARQDLQLEPLVALRLRLARLESLLVPTAPRLALRLESLPLRPSPARQESTRLARQVLQLESLALMALRLAGLDSLLVVPTAPPRLAQQVLQLESLQLRLARQVLQLEPLVALRLARH